MSVSKDVKKGELKESEEKNIFRKIPSHRSNWDYKNRVFEYEIHLPGVNKSDITLKVIPNMFELTANRENVRYVLNECFPNEINVNTAKLTYDNGLLMFSGKILNLLDKAVDIKLLEK